MSGYYECAGCCNWCHSEDGCIEIDGVLWCPECACDKEEEEDEDS